MGMFLAWFKIDFNRKSLDFQAMLGFQASVIYSKTSPSLKYLPVCILFVFLHLEPEQVCILQPSLQTQIYSNI